LILKYPLKMPTLHLIIKGKVQGVFYRATAKDVADDLGIKGWIKNTEDDDVEAIVTGPDGQLKKFVDWCWEGPRRAEVRDVLVEQAEDKTFEQFEIIRKK
jgi:acylphosphatase